MVTKLGRRWRRLGLSVSHELRTPMTALLGYIELLRPRLAGADGDTESLDAIGKSGRHLLALVDDILDLSRIESGKLVLERVEFSLPEIVEEVVSLAMLRALEKGLRLDVCRKRRGRGRSVVVLPSVSGWLNGVAENRIL